MERNGDGQTSQVLCVDRRRTRPARKGSRELESSVFRDQFGRADDVGVEVMVWPRRFWLCLQGLFLRNRSAQRLDDEIQFHLDQQIAENLTAGMSPQEARYAAMRTFGNPTYLKEETRDTWGWPWPEQIASDLRYAARMLRKSHGFTAIAV